MKKNVLSIAGFDPSSGAGLQADLKIFNSLSLHGLTVPTCLTIQNTKSVTEIYKIPIEISTGVIAVDSSSSIDRIPRDDIVHNGRGRRVPTTDPATEANSSIVHDGVAGDSRGGVVLAIHAAAITSDRVP